MAFGPGFHEGFHRRIGGVITEDREQGIDEHGFAVATGALQEKQRMFLRGA